MTRRVYLRKDPSIPICFSCPLSGRTCDTLKHGSAEAQKLKTEPVCLINYAWWHRVPLKVAADIAQRTLGNGLSKRFYYRDVKREGERLKVKRLIVKAREATYERI